ncbi:MAG TPA: cyclic nucleotide-binding domain-containing protein [Acidimicrobiia bacterium]|nr:cyclic nucleotide-binding domain-containing protein [Acidimicrobiia bacterium]
MPLHDRSVYLMYTRFLERIPMFRSCSEEELNHVADLASGSSVDEGETIIKQGDLADEFFVIVSGTAEVSRDGKTIASLEPGDYFGELALFDHALRNATVTATSPVELVSFSRDAFEELLDAVGSLRHAVMVGMARRLHELEGRA